jgi:catechol 2,3-dioxygenase-like lactoylglutathione lyase family enzyme
MSTGSVGIGVSRLGQIAINVHDLHRAVSFYRDNLGLPLLFTAGDMGFFDCGGVRLMLSRPEKPEFDHPSSVLYFTVPDIERAYRQMEAKGVRFEGRPHLIAKLPAHDLWMAFFQDSEGNLLALMSEVPRELFQPDMKSDTGVFTEGIRTLVSTLTESLAALTVAADVRQRNIEHFFAESIEGYEQDGKRLYRFRDSADDHKSISHQLPLYRGFFIQKSSLQRVKASSQALPQLLFSNLAELYLGYIKTLIRSLLYLCPNLLQSGSATNQAVDEELLGPQDAARERRVEQQAGYALQQGLDELFAWVDAALNTGLKAGIPISPELIEVTERMNLHACNGGIVSDRYIEVCRRCSVPLENVHAGDRLEITSEYFYRAADIVFAAGIKLGHLLWRHVLPDQWAKANAILQDLTFTLIQEQQYALADTLLDFANTVLVKYADENNRLVFLVNGALAAYLANDKAKCGKMLRSVDWQNTPDVLRLAHLVLDEQYNDAAVLMRQIGAKARPTKGEYLRWPLFEEFRKTPQFLTVFKEVFSEITLTETEVSPGKPNRGT